MVHRLIIPVRENSQASGSPTPRHARDSGRRSGVSPTTAGGVIALPVSVYLLLTSIVLGRLRPGSVLRTRFIAPFAVLLLIVGFSARGLTMGFAVPMKGGHRGGSGDRGSSGRGGAHRSARRGYRLTDLGSRGV